MVGYKDKTSPWVSVEEALLALEAGDATVLKSTIRQTDADCTFNNGDTSFDLIMVPYEVRQITLENGSGYVVKDFDHDPNDKRNDTDIAVDNQTLAHLLEPRTPWIIGGKMIIDQKHDWGTYHIQKGVVITPYVTGNVLDMTSANRVAHSSKILPLGLVVGDYDLQPGNIIIHKDGTGNEQASLIDVTHGWRGGIPKTAFLGESFGKIIVENPQYMLDVLTPHRAASAKKEHEPFIKEMHRYLPNMLELDQDIMQKTATEYAERIQQEKELFIENLGDVTVKQLQGRIDLVRKAIDNFDRPTDVFDNRVFSFSMGPKKSAPGD